jgi:hypothetical protein
LNISPTKPDTVPTDPILTGDFGPPAAAAGAPAAGPVLAVAPAPDEPDGALDAPRCPGDAATPADGPFAAPEDRAAAGCVLSADVAADAVGAADERATLPAEAGSLPTVGGAQVSTVEAPSGAAEAAGCVWTAGATEAPAAWARSSVERRVPQPPATTSAQASAAVARQVWRADNVFVMSPPLRFVRFCPAFSGDELRK